MTIWKNHLPFKNRYQLFSVKFLYWNRWFIGAGSLVTSNIPNNNVAAGVPAKVNKSFDEYKHKL